MPRLDELRELLSVPRRIVVTMHTSPDADALGSSLGLSHYLKAKGHDVSVLVPDEYPRFLRWMEGINQAIVHSEKTAPLVAQKVAEAELICCLDFNDLKRCGAICQYIEQSTAPKMMIDHHLEPSGFDDFRFWEPTASSTCELILLFVHMLDGIEAVDKGMAECLYAGIMTDTGSFRFPATSEQVHHIAGHLVGLGVDNAKIQHYVYGNTSESRLRFLGFALSERLVVLEDERTAYFAITPEDLERFHYRPGDTEGFVNYALQIEGIILAAMFTDRGEGEVRISFRSIGDFPANELAKNHFNGGGHKNAAGGRTQLSLKETVDRFTNVLHDEYLSKLQSTVY